MALSRWGRRLLGALLVAGTAGDGATAILFADELPPEISVLSPDEELGPIRRLPNIAADTPADWSPHWRQPGATKSTKSPVAPANALAPPEIDLPIGTDAPGPESSAAKSAPARKRGTKTVEATHASANERRLLRPKTSKPAAEPTKTSDSPISIDIPGLDPGESVSGGADTAPDSASKSAPKRNFISRVFRSQPATPTSDAAAARTTRPGWGLFRGVPISR